MGKLTGKVIKASAMGAREGGVELRRLRLLSGLTQAQMARRLGVQQSAISKIERGGEVYLSTVRRYVEALGASLRVDAVFPTDTPVAIRLLDAVDVQCDEESQLILPLLEDAPLRPRRDVVLSIRPQYSERIIEGRKTVELRRRFPESAPKGTVAFIYATSPTRAMVGTAKIKQVLKLPIEQLWSEFEGQAFIERDQFLKYFQGTDFGYALILGSIRRFTRPVPLSELRNRFDFQPPQSFLYASQELRKALNYESAVVSN